MARDRLVGRGAPMPDLSGHPGCADDDSDARRAAGVAHSLRDARGEREYDRACLLGLRRARTLCRLIDAEQRRDGLLREPVDCAEAIEAEIDRIQRG